MAASTLSMIWLAVRPVIKAAATFELFVDVRSFAIRNPMSIDDRLRE
jgi:hypothetical protein